MTIRELVFVLEWGRMVGEIRVTLIWKIVALHSGGERDGCYERMFYMPYRVENVRNDRI